MHFHFLKIPIFNALAAALFLAALAHPACGGTVKFEVQGEADHTVYYGPRDPAKLGHFRSRFSVTVDDDKYFIRIVPTFEQNRPEERYVEVGFDGKQQYVYQRSGLTGGADATGKERVVDIALLGQERIPYAEPDPVIPVLWFAFASGTSFRQEIPERLGPLWMVPVPPQYLNQVRYRLKCELLQKEGTFRLPKEAIFRSEGADFFFNPSGGLTEGKLPPPFDKGYTMAEYFVSDTTAAAGLVLPKTALYTQNGRVKTTSGKPVVLYKILLSVTNVPPRVERTSFVPRFVTAATLGDSRVRDKPQPIAPTYNVTAWPALDSPLAQYETRRAEEAQRNYQFATAAARAGHFNKLVFFLAATAAASVAAVLWIRKKQRGLP